MGLNPGNLAEISSGITIPSQWTQERPGARPCDHTFRILYVGRVVPEKNLHLTLDAFRILIDKYNGTLLLDIVGGGHGLERLRGYSANIGVAEFVTFWGPIPRHRLAPFYRSADLFLFTSQTDTQGLVLSEAAWFGVPCLVVDSDSTFLTKSQGAVFVAPPLARRVAEAIESIMKNPHTRAHAAQMAQDAARQRQAESSTAIVELLMLLAGERRPNASTRTTP